MNAIDRILDANMNRAREGLRVAEETARLVLEDPSLQRRFKALRHAMVREEKKLSASLIASRAVRQDPGAVYSTASEKQKSDLATLVQANMRRVQEAVRVLEEVSKLKNAFSSKGFKKIRFQTYDLEYDIIRKMTSRRKSRIT